MAESGATKVQLHVYDLSQGMARAMSAQLLGKQIEGVWHTGIIAFGEEWYFGGGIQRGTPGFTHFGRPLRVLDLGETHLPREVFEEFLVDIAPRFTMQTYHLLRHNCNNFSDEVAQFLVGEGIPSHILSLPDEVLSTPFGQQLMPMLSMMDAQMRTASEGASVGGFGSGATFAAPPRGSADLAPAAPEPRRSGGGGGSGGSGGGVRGGGGRGGSARGGREGGIGGDHQGGIRETRRAGYEPERSRGSGGARRARKADAA